MMYAVCHDCGVQFRKFSTKATDSICYDCRNRGKGSRSNIYNQMERALEKDKESVINRMDSIEERMDSIEDLLKVLHEAIGATVIPIVEEQMEKVAKETFETLAHTISEQSAGAYSRSRSAVNSVEELSTVIKNLKSQVTRFRNHINQSVIPMNRSLSKK